jgi:hypothetical protein
MKPNDAIALIILLHCLLIAIVSYCLVGVYRRLTRQPSWKYDSTYSSEGTDTSTGTPPRAYESANVSGTGRPVNPPFFGGGGFFPGRTAGRTDVPRGGGGGRANVEPEVGGAANVYPRPGGRINVQPGPGGRANVQPEDVDVNVEPGPGGRANVQPDPGGRANVQPDPGGRANVQPDPGGRANVQPAEIDALNVEPGPEGGTNVDDGG